MKTKFEREPDVFQPVTFSITCERHEDLLALLAIFHASSTGKGEEGAYGTTLYGALKRAIQSERDK